MGTFKFVLGFEEGFGYEGGDSSIAVKIFIQTSPRLVYDSRCIFK